MINYICCKYTTMEKIYEAFKIGFSDYIIKIDLSIEDFKSRFFGPEGNQVDKSFIAMDNDKPIGLILSGMKIFDGNKTLRCGTLCIDPNYRKMGIAKDLFELHKNVAIENQCKQLFLEVISQNEKAINLYKKLGYRKEYDLIYYSNKNIQYLKDSELIHNICEINFDEFSIIKNKLENMHINWQNDFDYMNNMGNHIRYFAAYKNSKIKGAIAVSNSGKIYSIWVDKGYRRINIGTDLIIKAIKELNLNIMAITFPNNVKIEGFLEKLCFKKDQLSQYEMFLDL